MNLPAPLAQPFHVAGQVACRIVLDLTVYLASPLSVAEFDHIVELYRSACPSNHLVRYKIAEFADWDYVASPRLTASGRQAASSGLPHPYVEPVRQRIQAGRGFEFRYWDNSTPEVSSATWSLTCFGIHLRESGVHSVARILLPLDSDLSLLIRFARDLVENVRFSSGHGGLVFGYVPLRKVDAFDHIYRLSKRYWGVDVEDLNATLPVANSGLKTIGWLTLLGRELEAGDPRWSDLARECARVEGVDVELGRYGYLLRIGDKPAVIDTNRPHEPSRPYFQLGRILAPLFVDRHPDFEGVPFREHANTMGWIRRFVEPAGWR